MAAVYVAVVDCTKKVREGVRGESRHQIQDPDVAAEVSHAEPFSDSDEGALMSIRDLMPSKLTPQAGFSWKAQVAATHSIVGAIRP